MEKLSPQVDSDMRCRKMVEHEVAESLVHRNYCDEPNFRSSEAVPMIHCVCLLVRSDLLRESRLQRFVLLVSPYGKVSAEGLRRAFPSWGCLAQLQ